MRYSLRQLEVFLAAAHFENITKAAQNLSMSQSAASSALKELEQQFDIQLFDRVGKRLQLNELGRLLRPRAASLLAQAQELEIALQQHQQPGNLKVGATLSIGNYLAVNLMAQYMASQPDAKVTLDVENTAAIARKVVNFELDVGLVEGEIQHPELEVIPWREDELVVFASCNHPLAAAGKVLDDQALKSANWILRETGSGTRQTFDRIMSGILPELNVLLELQHTEAIKRAVEAGMGLGCLSRVTLEDAFSRGALVPLAIPHRNTRRLFYFILHKQKYRSAGVSRWLQLCREASDADAPA
ncbi:LysR family transcriptional regulator [Oceanospirillum linum]|uniref:LysR family transcriptional regulator n=1 Tax=Oceanospirillum linum TaxID=966 RepID=A0A1T1HEA7_OCELI|nr:LysR family transcriptional regulator [Oceanospirillum linum]OOV88070.1 LysR family transcriptional regulator [Oceanospirillum linum]SEF42128.1 DNA-binding transcriptional regulator, LysR family [Oleiphilus messinensis]SMP00958.1 DNA-binding transcriptional regulator, LysR family [Oceanospirillum linum]